MVLDEHVRVVLKFRWAIVAENAYKNYFTYKL